MTEYKISERLQKVAANHENEYEGAVLDEMYTESDLHDGVHRYVVTDIANQLWCAMAGVESEVESGSMMDELMSSVVALAYDQALKRAAKLLNVPFKELQDKEWELTDKEV